MIRMNMDQMQMQMPDQGDGAASICGIGIKSEMDVNELSSYALLFGGKKKVVSLNFLHTLDCINTPSLLLKFRARIS